MRDPAAQQTIGNYHHDAGYLTMIGPGQYGVFGHRGGEAASPNSPDNVQPSDRMGIGHLKGNGARSEEESAPQQRTSKARSTGPAVKTVG
jgi:hypothetical protein